MVIRSRLANAFTSARPARLYPLRSADNPDFPFEELANLIEDAEALAR